MSILSGTIMNTSGSVHDKIIIDRPARYVNTNHKGYDNSFPVSITVSFVTAKTPPTKISEKSTNKATIRNFFVANGLDIT